ncbi:MAG: NADH-quinone oxidoreductase subunit A [Verrucomicrobiae bacterium]|nr:NADH-quinone oxidoreductase subunit A [Verrucomicrobiae bacterium]
MLRDYLPVLILIVIAVGFCGVTLIASAVIGKRGRHNPIKDSPYECGLPTTATSHPRFYVKFYRVAMLFILFDIEVVFLFPWAVVYREHIRAHQYAIFGSMLSFLAILFIGYLYALKKGALDWEK